MRILDVINAGYSPVSFRNKLIVDYFIDTDLGILCLDDIDRDTVHVSLDKDHTELPIEYELAIIFKEETAAALLVSGITPVTKADVTLSRRFRRIKGRRRSGWESEKEATLSKRFIPDSSNLF